MARATSLRSRSSSASTINWTSPSNETVGSQPSSRFAFDESPTRLWSSADPRCSARVDTDVVAESSPTCSNAVSTRSRTPRRHARSQRRSHRPGPAGASPTWHGRSHRRTPSRDATRGRRATTSSWSPRRIAAAAWATLRGTNSRGVEATRGYRESPPKSEDRSGVDSARDEVRVRLGDAVGRNWR